MRKPLSKQFLKSNLRLFVRSFWATVLFGIIGLAVLVQLARAVFPVLNDYRAGLEHLVSRQVGAEVTFGQFDASWQGLTPRIAIQNLAVKFEGQHVFSAAKASLEWGLLASIKDWRAGIRKLQFEGLEADFIQNKNGQWQVSGLPAPTTASTNTADKQPIIDDPVDIFVFGRRLELLNTRLGLHFRSGAKADVTVKTILLENDNQFHRLKASLGIDGEQALTLVVEGYGDPRDEDEFTAKGFMQSQGFSGARVIDALKQSELIKPNSRLIEYLPVNGDMHFALWFKGTLRRGVLLSGRVKLDNIFSADNSTIDWPQNIATEFKGHWQAQTGWELGLNDTSATWEDFQTSPTPMIIGGGVDKPLFLRLAKVDIAEWVSVINKTQLLPKRAAKVINTLAPAGVIHTADIQLTNKADGYFLLKAELEDGSAKAWQGAPALSGVTGFVEANALDGHISIDAQKPFSMAFPRIYYEPLTFTKAEGDVRWTLYPKERWVGVSSGDLILSHKDFTAKGDFNLRLPYKYGPESEPEMTLKVGVKKTPVKYHKTFVPHTVPKSLYQWLGDAKIDGIGHNVAFIYHGTLMSHSSWHRAIQLFAQVEDAALTFDPAWPRLENASGYLLIDDQHVIVRDLKSTLFDNQIDHGSVTLKRSAEDKRYLDISGQAKGATKNALALLMNSPVVEQLDKSMAHWQLTGSYMADVSLSVPIEKGGVHKQDVKAQLLGNTMYLPDLNLGFEALEGDLNFHHDKGLYAHQLDAKFWGQPAQAQIYTAGVDDKKALNIVFETKLDVASLRQWSKQSTMFFLTGVTDVSGALTVPYSGDLSLILEAQSDLKGVHVSLPPPYDKLPEVGEQLHFKLERQRGKAPQMNSRIRLADKARLHWQDQGSEFIGATLALTHSEEGDALDEVSDAVRPGQFFVTGKTPKLDGLVWYEVLQTYLAYNEKFEQQERAKLDKGTPVEGAIDDALPIAVDVHVSPLMLDDLSVGPFHVTGQSSETLWTFNFKSPVLAGAAKIYDDDKPINLHLDYLLLPEDEPVVEQSHDAVNWNVRQPPLNESDGGVIVQPPGHEDILTQGAMNPGPENVKASALVKQLGRAHDQSVMAEWDLAAIAAADINVDNFAIGKQQWGAWKFKLRPTEGGLMAYDLYANISGLKLSGDKGRGANMIWLENSGLHTTHFSGVATASDISPAIESIQGEKMLTSTSSNMDIQIQWDGAPDEIALENLTGVVKLDLRRGRFIRGATVGENPLLKLIGLFNFDTLARRLRLDFSDLNPEGMAYESVTGELLFVEQTIKIKSPLLVDTPSTQLQLVGDIQLVEETLDAQLIATLPVTGNLTVAAALTGGIPIAVGVYVLGKVFKNQVDKASSIRYNIRGSWDDPKVKFDKVFEDTVTNTR